TRGARAQGRTREHDRERFGDREPARSRARARFVSEDPRRRRGALGESLTAMTTFLVGGALANKYLNGGEAWVRLSWIRGFQRLGYRVHFVEQIDTAACVDEHGEPAPFERSAARAYFDRVVDQFGLTGAATLVLCDGQATSGLAYEDLLDLAADAE